METKDKKILVTGATGYIGGRLVPRLLEQGYGVRCLARHPEVLKGRNWEGVEVLSGDVLSPESLRGKLEGIQTAYYLIHSMRSGEAVFRERDRRAAENFSRAAQTAGIGRIIYLGGLGSRGDELSPHLFSRQEVGNILRQFHPHVTEFRAAIIVGSGSLSFEMIRYLTERLPVMICPRWLKSRVQPIAVRDVLSYLVAALENPQSEDRIIEIGGADVLTYKDMLQTYASVRGLKRWLISVPVLTPRLSSYWVDLVTPIPASISRPLIEGLRNDVICHEEFAPRGFSVEPISYRKAVELALQRISGNEVETIWSGSQASLGRFETDRTLVENREGMIVETRIQKVRATPERVFRVFSGIGGERGWFYANALWRLRGFLDRILGGTGMRRGRRDPDQLRVGDALDFWRVENLQIPQRLRLRAEMKVPGKAWLQFEVEGQEKGFSQLTQKAFFEPKGLTGLLYWFILYPIHRLIFSGLCREICQRAENRID